MAELTYAELTQGRESTRLPHTHRFTSLKNVVISALHKIDKRIHIQAMLNSYGRDRIFNTQLTAIKNSYNKVNV